MILPAMHAFDRLLSICDVLRVIRLGTALRFYTDEGVPHQLPQMFGAVNEFLRASQ